jgi:hypothetical protein
MSLNHLAPGTSTPLALECKSLAADSIELKTLEVENVTASGDVTAANVSATADVNALNVVATLVTADEVKADNAEVSGTLTAGSISSPMEAFRFTQMFGARFDVAANSWALYGAPGNTARGTVSSAVTKAVIPFDSVLTRVTLMSDSASGTTEYAFDKNGVQFASFVIPNESSFAFPGSPSFLLGDVLEVRFPNIGTLPNNSSLTLFFSEAP